MIVTCGSIRLTRNELAVTYECQICKVARDMMIMSYRRWFIVLFLPIYPQNDPKYYAKCQTCGNSFFFEKQKEVGELVRGSRPKSFCFFRLRKR